MTLRAARMAVAAVFFVYVLAMRTYDVATTFLMLGEQTRDWTIALGGLTDLPLVGAPSTAGGRGFGPAYYYLLWLGRVTLGPFMDNLPHAGGITVALLQSIGDAWLFLALSRRIHWALALATCLLIASGPFDIAISSVIWNPPVSEALIKMAIATALTLHAASPAWHTVLAAALAWTAVQAHLSAVFVAAPLLLGVAIQPLLAKRHLTFAHDTDAGQARIGLRQSVKAAALIASAIVVLQIPFILSLAGEPNAPAGPTSAIANLTSGQSFLPMAALDTVTGVTGNLFLPMPDAFRFWAAFAVAAPIVLVAYRRDAIFLGASAGAILTATIVFSTWTRGYDRYWFLTLTPALALTFLGPVAAIPWRQMLMPVGLALTIWFASWQPARIAASEAFFEYPQYETMIRGSREIVLRAPVVRDIKVAFEVHPTMDRHFVYTILGGRIDPTAVYTAVISADGSVRLE